MAPALSYLAQHFRVLRLRITLRLEADWQLPAYKGSVFHGWLGQSAKQYDEHLFHVLFAEHDAGQPKPYALKLNEEHKTHWRRNELVWFDVTLFGEATQLAEQLVEALQSGCKLGLGDRVNQQRCPIELINVASITPFQRVPGIRQTYLSDWFTPIAESEQIELALQLKSPLRLKRQGKVQETFKPDLYLLNQQTCRRLTLLSKFWVCDDANLLKDLNQSQPRLGEYQFTDHTYFEDWQRFSLKNKRLTSFGGLKGQLSYFGQINDAKPWLQVAEVLGVGGKTTFGLGHFDLIG